MDSAENSDRLQKILLEIQSDPRYLKNIEFGEPRPGHPEGKVKFHIVDLEKNLELLAQRGISSEDILKLRFLIHIHDTFKAEAERDASILHPRSHASLAREYASQFTDDADLLNMIQFHDKNYALWLEYLRKGSYNAESFQQLLNTIQDWDLFLMFLIVDGRTRGKDLSKLVWFINEVGNYKTTRVDISWVDPL